MATAMRSKQTDIPLGIHHLNPTQQKQLVLLLSTIWVTLLFFREETKNIFCSAYSPARLDKRIKPTHSSDQWSRRDALTSTLHISSSFFIPSIANAVSAPTAPLEGKSGSKTRIEELGGGFDLFSPPTSASLPFSDVFYPSSTANTQWKVQRVVTSVEGDLGQAALAWKLLGGGEERAFTSKQTEVYHTRFTAAPEDMEDALYIYDGKIVRASILDRAFELSSRMGLSNENSVQWKGNTVIYSRDNKSLNESSDTVAITVVQRKNEPLSETGFGYDELYRITSSAGGLFANLDRAARVRRRYRRGFDESSGKRILDGIEIMTTYRVLDGVAGVEMPTSTCKSKLRYTEL